MRNIFKIKREEVLPSLAALAVLVTLHGLMLYKFGSLFLKAHHVSYWQLFGRTFHVSGFDDWSYCFMSNGKLYFDILRHPLYAVILSPFYALNKALMAAGDTNYAMIFMAFLLMVSAFYAYIFLYRIFREVIGVSRWDTILLTAFFYSFGMILVSMMVPDHFCWSLFMLTMTLYLAGSAMKTGKRLGVVVTTVLGFFTGGVTLSNFVKTYLTAWLVNGRKVFHWRYVVPGVVSLALLIGIAYCLQTQVRDAQVAEETRMAEKIYAKNPERARTDSIHHAKVMAKSAKPMSDEGLLKWTDGSTPRMDALIHNMFGESVQIHDNYLLSDMVVDRPPIVKYNHVYNYIVEALVVLLFLAGVFAGRRHKFFLMVLSWFAFDIFLHFGLGFGLDEMYIMATHWMFVIPIAVAYLLLDLGRRGRSVVRWSVLLLTLYLWAWNGYLIFIFMSDQVLRPIKYFS